MFAWIYKRGQAGNLFPAKIVRKLKGDKVMQGQIELRNIMFDNLDSMLNLAPKQAQQPFIEPISKMISIAYAGINENCSGFLQAIYYNAQPVGAILIGKSPISEEEPPELQKYEYAYRIVGFFVDQNYQSKGIGRAALKLAFDKLENYPESKELPLYLECHKDNEVALSLYKLFGFLQIDHMFEDGYCVLVRFPERTNPCKNC